MEKLQQDSIKGVEEHQQEVLGAISSLMDKATTVPAAQAQAPTVTAPAKTTGSLFLGGGNGKSSQGRVSMFLPEGMSYAEKKAVARPPARDDLISRSRIAASSRAPATRSPTSTSWMGSASSRDCGCVSPARSILKRCATASF
jgi:hypothetical protein